MRMTFFNQKLTTKNKEKNTYIHIKTAGGEIKKDLGEKQTPSKYICARRNEFHLMSLPHHVHNLQLQ